MQNELRCVGFSFFRWHLAASSKDLRVMAIGAINRASFAAAAAKALQSTQAPPSRQLQPAIHVASGSGGGTGTAAAAAAAAAAEPLGPGPYSHSRRGSQMATAASSMVRGAAVSGIIQMSKAIHICEYNHSPCISHQSVLPKVLPVLDDVVPSAFCKRLDSSCSHSALAEGGTVQQFAPSHMDVE